MFAKRRADVPNLGFSPFHKLCAQGKGNAINTAHRKHFSVGSTLKKIETMKKNVNIHHYDSHNNDCIWTNNNDL
jgi:hypothetical protein